MEAVKYDVFISYSRKDYIDDNNIVIPGNAISIIKNRLSEEGISYWFDDEGIYSGQNFVEKIVTNIEASKIFLYLSTVNANESKWTCKEIASADEFGKPIIPVRIDKSPYNKKVMFRISDLDYIEYYTNPENALNDLIISIKAHLQSIQEEENRKKEEEAKKREAELKRKEEEKARKEQEEKRRREEQQRIVADIELACTKLNNEEKKIELDRSTLLVSTEKVADEKQKNELKTFITSSSPIRQKLSEDLKRVQEKITELESTIESLTNDKERLEAELGQAQNIDVGKKDKKNKELIEKLKKELADTKKAFESSEKERKHLAEQLVDLQKQLEDGSPSTGSNSNEKKHWRIWPWGIGMILSLTAFYISTIWPSYENISWPTLSRWVGSIAIIFIAEVLLLAVVTCCSKIYSKKHPETHFKDAFYNFFHNQWIYYTLFILLMITITCTWGVLCNVLIHNDARMFYHYSRKDEIKNLVLLAPLIEEPLWRLLPFLLASIPMAFIGRKPWMKILKVFLGICFGLVIIIIQVAYSEDVSYSGIVPQGQGELYAIVYGVVLYISYKAWLKKKNKRKIKALLFAHLLALVSSVLVHAFTNLALIIIGTF